MAKKQIKRILISQPKPAELEKSPYYILTQKYNIEIDYQKFFKVQRLTTKQFREQRIYLENYNLIIFTSKSAVDHFFSMAKDLRFTPPETTKYVCLSEAIALYLQKYIQFRKRKIFHCDNNYDELINLLKKTKEDKRLLPCSDEPNEILIKLFEDNNIEVVRAVFFKTVKENLKNYDLNSYDMIVMFSPAGVRSIKENFPNFKQGDLLVATFGETTKKAAIENNFRVDIFAPTEKFPSMVTAIEDYVAQTIKKTK